MARILFPRIVQGPAGGEIKVREYFDHCLSYGLDPYLYATPEASPPAGWHEIWNGIPQERVVLDIDLSRYDLVFLGGRTWELLPHVHGTGVINLIQHVRHGDPRHPALFGYLKRFAHRICVSRQVLEAIAPHAVGPAIVIQNGIPLEHCTPFATRVRRSVLIPVHKRAEFGATMGERLLRKGIRADVLDRWIPRREFFRRLGSAEVFVGLPNQTEGFYLPALEAMANGCAVVCSDAVGNRDFCIPGQTCLQPQYDDLDGYVEAVLALLRDDELRARVRSAGIATAQGFDLKDERRAFHHFLDGLLGKSR